MNMAFKAKKTKTKGSDLPVPQSREEAQRFIREIGESNRQIARIEADMNDQIANMKEGGELAAAPLYARVQSMTEGLRIWCDANRDALTDGGKRKFADLGTGRIEWRLAPPKVWIKGVDAALAAIKTLGLSQFLRAKEKIDKEAMLREPERARLVPGVTIGSAGENFAVEPFEAELEGAKS
jgi:phage host-nuclease inhibitor protein Gam